MANEKQDSPGEKRGGYSGSTDAAKVPPPAKIPSATMPPGNGRLSEK
ncbi:MAG: hypothetical protein QOH97_705 [Actinoplanes sp.]|jgi:hypothetical protein|nr:hypothetical protein [Actinoplanes sp.]